MGNHQIHAIDRGIYISNIEAMSDPTQVFEPFVIEGKIEIPYSYAAGEMGSRFLTELRDHKRILGVRCASCASSPLRPPSRHNGANNDGRPSEDSVCVIAVKVSLPL